MNKEEANILELQQISQEHSKRLSDLIVRVKYLEKIIEEKTDAIKRFNRHSKVKII